MQGFQSRWATKSAAYKLTVLFKTNLLWSSTALCNACIFFSLPLPKVAWPWRYAVTFQGYRNDVRKPTVATSHPPPPSSHPTQFSALPPQRSNRWRNKSRKPPSISAWFRAAASDRGSFPSSTVTSHLAPSTAQGGQEPPPLDRSAAPAEPGEVGITSSRSRLASSSTPTFAFTTEGDPNSYLIPKTEGFCSGLLTTTKRLLPWRTSLVVFDVAVAFD